MKEIISKIAKTTIPSKIIQKSKKEIADKVYKLVEKEIQKYSEVVELEFGGSYAKDTWISKNADIDIFIKFKKNISEEKLENISKKIGFESLKKYSPYVRYSQHPYVEAKIKDTKINIVPCYDVKIGEWKSAADRSPFHTKFMKKSLTRKMRNEVRILKTFLKSNKIYGAEIAKQGFSGYISEVLILQYGSFENLIKSIIKIKEKQIIGKTSKSFDTAIVVIDPIDGNRNLAAAISNENIGKFILSFGLHHWAGGAWSWCRVWRDGRLRIEQCCVHMRECGVHEYDRVHLLFDVWRRFLPENGLRSIRLS